MIYIGVGISWTQSPVKKRESFGGRVNIQISVYIVSSIILSTCELANEKIVDGA